MAKVLFVDGFAQGRIINVDKSTIEFGRIELTNRKNQGSRVIRTTDNGLVDSRAARLIYKISSISIFGEKILVGHSLPVAKSCLKFFVDSKKRSLIEEVINERAYVSDTEHIDA